MSTKLTAPAARKRRVKAREVWVCPLGTAHEYKDEGCYPYACGKKRIHYREILPPRPSKRKK